MIGRKKRKYTRKNSEQNLPTADNWQLHPETKRTVLIIFLFTFSLLGLISLFNGAGTIGQWLKLGLGKAFGWTDWLVLLLILVVDFFLVFSEKYPIKKVNYVGLALLLLSLGGLLNYSVANDDLATILANQSGGGYLGYLVGHNLSIYAGFWGGLIILFGLFLTGAIIFFNTSFQQITRLFSVLSWGGSNNNYQANAETIEEQLIEEEINLPAEEIKTPLVEEEESEEVETEEEVTPEKESKVKRSNHPIKKVEIPIDLLNSTTNKPTSGDIKGIGAKIQKALEQFGIGVTMADVNVGPTVTQYTLKPDEGVKLSQITTLQNDISLAVAAHPIRIEAPIPGKSLIGIEIPNQSVSIVRLREILTSEVFANRKSNLMIALGKDVTGKAIMADLGKMPHLLIAGATGSGKSVAINNIIVSLLWQNSPSDLKLIMVDPKRVELSVYNDIPHLKAPVITDVKATINALRWVVHEMDERYKILASASKRNIDSYNASILINRLPYLVVIIDELADLMAVAAKEVEAAITRLAQMARAVGIHLILATQRPSVNVITGLIKANMSSRIAFTVVSQTDSRTILDMSGAEKLLSNGDMLFRSAEMSKPRRIQGSYISEKEVSAVVDFLRQTGEPEYDLSITESQGRAASDSSTIDGDEEDLAEAARIVVKAGRASATMLQSRMRIGYAKADRLLMQLEDRNIVGPPNGSKPREILIDEAELINSFPLEQSSQLTANREIEDLTAEQEEDDDQNF